MEDEDVDSLLNSLIEEDADEQVGEVDEPMDMDYYEKDFADLLQEQPLIYWDQKMKTTYNN